MMTCSVSWTSCSMMRAVCIVVVVAANGWPCCGGDDGDGGGGDEPNCSDASTNLSFRLI